LRHTLRLLTTRGAPLVWIALHAGCGGNAAPTTDAQVNDEASAGPTFDALFTRYFAAGTPGHCATSGCHADPGHNVWLCSDAQGCYQGLVELGLIDAEDADRSRLIDPKTSPLSWINQAGGNMPLDAQGDNADARAAIEAWIAAGAPLD
jgi:hypothetical protein